MSPRALGAIATPALTFLLLALGSVPRAEAAEEPSPACRIPFALESADTLGAVGVQSSLAIDAGGEPHIAYLNASGSQVRYARKNGSQWTSQRIPQIGFFHGVSLALDAAGNVSIGYAAQEETSRGVITSAKVARRSSGSWTIETVETAFATEVAVGFDPDGMLHAVYFSFIPGFVIRYATRTLQGWTIETVFPTLGLGADRFSLAFDPQGHPNVTAQVALTLLHAVRTSSGWVTDKQPRGEGVSLAVDAQGIPHVASHLRTPPVVQYRTRDGSVWHVEAVDSVDAGPERDLSLQIDRYGRPIIAYLDTPAGKVKVAWKDGNTWRTQVVDDAGGGEGPSLWLKDGVQPAISYLDGAGYDLRYASGEIAPPNRAPAANAGGPYAGTIGEQLGFDGTRSSDPDGQPLAYSWDFGDGIEGTGSNPEHVYAAARYGKSRVTLSLEGALNSGARVRGEAAFEIKKRRHCDGDCAAVLPNPLNPDGTLRFAISRPGSVTVELFDVQGKRFRTLLSPSFLPAGAHGLRIDGRDPSGRPLSSGIYFYRIRTPDRTLAGRFSVLK